MWLFANWIRFWLSILDCTKTATTHRSLGPDYTVLDSYQWHLQAFHPESVLFGSSLLHILHFYRRHILILYGLSLILASLYFREIHCKCSNYALHFLILLTPPSIGKLCRLCLWLRRIQWIFELCLACIHAGQVLIDIYRIIKLGLSRYLLIHFQRLSKIWIIIALSQSAQVTVH